MASVLYKSKEFAYNNRFLQLSHFFMYHIFPWCLPTKKLLFPAALISHNPVELKYMWPKFYYLYGFLGMYRIILSKVMIIMSHLPNKLIISSYNHISLLFFILFIHLYSQSKPDQIFLMIISWNKCKSILRHR